MRLWLDLETWSEIPINCGAHRYAEGAEVMLFAWAIDDRPVQVLDLTVAPLMPLELSRALSDDDVEVWAHNAGFDRTILRHAMPNHCPPLRRWRCSMVQAYMHSLPGALDKLCAVLRVPVDLAKDKAGRDLVKLFCMPRPKGQKLRRATSKTHPAEWANFVAYAGQDIVSMRECVRRMPAWNATIKEWSLWHLDQRINDRGVAIDRPFVAGAITAAERAQETLAERTVELTEGDVQRATQRDELLRHILETYGVTLPDMTAATLERRMQDPDLPAALRELIGIRLQASGTSVAKYKVLARATGTDGRLRGTLQFRGAGRTGRWAGRIFQPQNLARPSLKQDDIDSGIECVKVGSEHLIYDNVIELLTSAVRGSLIAAPGRKLVVADLSNIEGRFCAWLAGEEWKLQAFRDFDASLIVDDAGQPVLDKKGERQFAKPDLYRVAYGKAFAVPPETVDKDRRQIGKVMELMLQYQGGVGAFVTGAATYGVDLDDMADRALPSIPGDVLHEAEGFYDWAVEQKRPTFGLPRHVFIACDALKRLWRRAHPRIDTLWGDVESATRIAIGEPGRVIDVRGKLKFRAVPGWLQVRLPSGRNLCYPAPRVADDGSISYMGLDQYTRQWKRIGTYGGKQLENFTQAGSCDQLAECMPAIEEAGYPIVLSVHDEVITEPLDDPRFSAEGLAQLMTVDLGWNKGLPLAAAGDEMYRYRKG